MQLILKWSAMFLFVILLILHVMYSVYERVREPFNVPLKQAPAGGDYLAPIKTLFTSSTADQNYINTFKDYFARFDVSDLLPETDRETEKYTVLTNAVNNPQFLFFVSKPGPSFCKDVNAPFIVQKHIVRMLNEEAGDLPTDVCVIQIDIKKLKKQAMIDFLTFLSPGTKVDPTKVSKRDLSFAYLFGESLTSLTLQFSNAWSIPTGFISGHDKGFNKYAGAFISYIGYKTRPAPPDAQSFITLNNNVLPMDVQAIGNISVNGLSYYNTTEALNINSTNDGIFLAGNTDTTTVTVSIANPATVYGFYLRSWTGEWHRPLYFKVTGNGTTYMFGVREVASRTGHQHLGIYVPLKPQYQSFLDMALQSAVPINNLLLSTSTVTSANSLKP